MLINPYISTFTGVFTNICIFIYKLFLYVYSFQSLDRGIGLGSLQEPDGPDDGQ